MKQLIYSLIFTISISAQNGYVFTDLELGVDNPIDIEFTSNKIIIAERDGTIWVADDLENPELRSTPIKDLEPMTSTFFERGLQSIITTETQMWVFHTLEENEYHQDVVSDSRFTVNRVMRYDVDWDNNTITSELKIMEIPSLAGNHQGGGMALINGALYVAIGDGGSSAYGNEAVEDGLISASDEALTSRFKAQLLGIPMGKILRVDPQTGNALPDNPFYDNDNSWLSRTWALGFRNPFDICETPEGNIIVADVGSGDREEITMVSTTMGGMNHGWGNYEGFNLIGMTGTNPSTGQPYTLEQPTSFDISDDLLTRVTTHRFPDIDYGHNGNTVTRLPMFDNGQLTTFNDANGIEGNSISGGTFIEGFGMDGHYMFTDYTRGWINVAIPSPIGGYFESTYNFADDGTVGIGVDITQSPNGDVYVARLFQGITRIRYESTLDVDDNDTDDDYIRYYQDTGFLDITLPVIVYDMSGKLLIRLKDSAKLDLSSGAYIVVSEKNSKKIIVKH